MAVVAASLFRRPELNASMLRAAEADSDANSLSGTCSTRFISLLLVTQDMLKLLYLFISYYLIKMLGIIQKSHLELQ